MEEGREEKRGREKTRKEVWGDWKRERRREYR
jgi:hypothetical protein